MLTGTPQPIKRDVSSAWTPSAVKTREVDNFYDDGANKEPHQERKKLIMAKYGDDVKKLMGPCWKTKYVVTATVLFQIAMCFLLREAHWGIVLACTYIISGTLNHMMTLAIHELSHDLAFKTPVYNRIFSLFANLPMGIPAAISFRRYHLEHHKYQGEHTVDSDVPTKLEAILFATRPGKVLWAFLQPLFYSLRPVLTNPKKPGAWEATNLIIIALFDLFIYANCGWRGTVYTVCGTLLGMGLHPVAGHFIAEHYVFEPGYETYSYYGILNIFAFNVGYHNEHHDFPNIPGSRLPQLKKIAAEFYDGLPQYDSWTQVIIDFITSKNVCQYDRIKRRTLSKEQRTELRERDDKRWGNLFQFA
eukprot:m.354964 g.354964  ORF g.354964 m.354964 type:complete len:361 (-) comp17145_c0_seq1:366-1448(-)